MEASVVTTPSGNTGPLGQPRGSARDPSTSSPPLLQLVLGLPDRGGDGKHTGGARRGAGLVIWILISPVMGFVIPSEIGRCVPQGRPEPPTSVWTGLAFPGAILIVPAIVWFVKVQGALNRYWESKGATAA